MDQDVLDLYGEPQRSHNVRIIGGFDESPTQLIGDSAGADS